jgi:hypothetical protein
MNIFQQSTERTLDMLQKRSKNITNIFSKTMEELRLVNEDIQTLDEEKKAQKAKIQSELNVLSIQEAENNNVISKLSKIFE